MTNLVLASGQITNHDEITIALVEPPDGTPPLVRVHWPLRPTTAATTHYPAVAAAIVEDHRRELNGARTAQGGRTVSNDLKGVPTVRGRSPRGRGPGCWRCGRGCWHGCVY